MQHRHPAARRQGAGLHLVTKKGKHFRHGTHKEDASLGALLRKRGILTEEAVPRMNGLAADLSCDSDDLRAIQVGGSSTAS